MEIDKYNVKRPSGDIVLCELAPAYCTFYALCLVSVPLRFEFIEKCKDRKLISTGQMTSRNQPMSNTFHTF